MEHIKMIYPQFLPPKSVTAFYTQTLLFTYWTLENVRPTSIDRIYDVNRRFHEMVSACYRGLSLFNLKIIRITWQFVVFLADIMTKKRFNTTHQDTPWNKDLLSSINKNWSPLIIGESYRIWYLHFEPKG